MSLPRVYSTINAITAAFANHGLPKERINLDDGYAYRGVDEVTERLAPLLAEHKLCILPRVLERIQRERVDPTGESLIYVSLRVAFDLVSVEDGSSHTIGVVGEALDHSDKASAKAMTSAYKHAVLHAFCIPVSGREDADRSSPGRGSTAALPAPVEGWAQWAQDIASVIDNCATPERRSSGCSPATAATSPRWRASSPMLTPGSVGPSPASARRWRCRLVKRQRAGNQPLPPPSADPLL